VVVPTGFEPVFQCDYDFALILQRLPMFSLSQKGVRLKQEVVRLQVVGIVGGECRNG
jgi:hypothetical protein